MTLILIFLGWFILSSMWRFLPVIEPLRQFAVFNLPRRRTTAMMSGALALLTGASFAGMDSQLQYCHAHNL